MTEIFTVEKMPGVCSMLTIRDICTYLLKNLSKEEFIELLYTQADLFGIKSVQFTLNKNRFWSWFTPFKFAYSYKNRFGDTCSVFYINL